jgi:hypothetical protein
VDVDVFALQLLEEAKRFLEKAATAGTDPERDAYVHASLLLAFAAFEAHINSIAEDFMVRSDLPIPDRSVLSEKEFQLDEGKWSLTDRLRMYRLEDRLEHLQRTFSTAPLDKSQPYWSHLKEGIHLRNRLTHAKQLEPISPDQAAKAIAAIIQSLDSLYLAIYKRRLPAAARGLSSTLDF